MMNEYCIHTENLTEAIITDLRALETEISHHLARTRFHLDLNDSVHIMFYYKYSDIIYPAEPGF